MGRAARTVLGFWLAGAAALAAAQAAPDVAAARAQQRAQLLAERQRIEAEFQATVAACRQRFAVTACVDEARQRRRDALAVPRTQALVLDDLERRERAVARREAVQAKQRKAAERALPASAAPAASRPARQGPAPAQAAAPRSNPASAAEASAAAASRRAQAAQQRQAEIEATQARIRARQAERARQGKVAAPLPVPAASR
jgi:hypothetical protein